MANIIFYGGILMNKNPRWAKEIPKPNKIEQKRKLSDEEKKEAKEFEKAVNSGRIEQWFKKLNN